MNPGVSRYHLSAVPHTAEGTAIPLCGKAELTQSPRFHGFQSGASRRPYEVRPV